MQVMFKTLAPAGPSIHETFNETVLHRLARLDVVPFDASLLTPFENGHAGEFGSVTPSE